MGSAKYKGCFWLFWISLFATEISAKVGFSSQNEYQYEYIGQITVGLPSVGTGRSAVRLSTNVLIQPDKNDIVVQFKDAKIQNGFVKDVVLSSEEIKDLPQQPTQPELGYPFKISYKSNSDEFKGIEVTSKDSAWSVDIKKAFAVFFHVRLDQQISKRQGYFANFKTPANFEPVEVTEPGIEGECTTKYIYRDHAWPGKPHLNVLNVTKIRDLSTCTGRPIWKQSILEPMKCASCQSTYENVKTEALISYYNAYEENGQYVLQSAESYGKIFISPNPPEGDKVKVSQYQSLRLQSIKPSSKGVSFPSSGIQHPTMAIAPQDIDMAARFRRQTKTTGVKRPSRILDPRNKIQIQKEKIDELVKQLQDGSENQKIEILKTVPYRIELVRELSYEDIQEVYNSVENNPDKRKLFINLILLSGTDASILFIKYLLEQRKITGEYAAGIISEIPRYILAPQPGILEEIWSLCKSTLKNDNRQIYVSTLLAFGELVNQACVPKESPKTIKPFQVKVSGCPQTLTSRYLQELFNLFDKSDHVWEKSAIAHTIYRMALNETIDFLIPYLQYKMFDLPSDVRTELLITLFEAGPGRQKEIEKYISPIFYNVSLTTEERAVAFELLAYSTTSQELINQLAMSTWKEPNAELARYIYSYFKVIKDLKIPCWEPFAIRSRRAIKLAKPFPDSILNSRMKAISQFSEKYSTGTFISFAAIYSPQFLFPKIAWYFTGNEALGYYFPNTEIAAVTTGLQRVLDHIIGPKADFVENIRLRDIFKYDFEQPETNTRHYGNLTFKVTPREDEPFSSRISVSANGNTHRLFFLDENTLNDIRNSGYLPPNKDLYSSLSDGIDINYQHLYLYDDTKLKLTSIVGIPLTVELVSPLYINIQGKIALEAAKTGITNALSTFQIKSQLQITVAEYGRVSVSIELLNNKLIGASATDEIYTSFPINGYVKADLARKSFSGALLTSHVGSYNKPQYSVIHRVVPKLYYIETNPNTGKLEIIKDHVFQEGGPQVLVGSDLIYVGKEWLSILNYYDIGWYPRKFKYSNNVLPALDSAGVDQVEWSINWKHSPAPYEEQLWRGKSFLERIRLWTLFPEWTDFPISCKDVISAGRLQTTTEPPKKKSWFSRFKDSVRSTFGRSGGDSVEEYDDDDDDKNKDDHGRALHPHIATSESTHRSGDESRSSLSSRGSQSRSISGSSYGETSYGTGYGYGQSHYGSEYDQSTGFSQTSNGDKDYDWEQKPGSHFTSQTTGRGQDHHGGSGGGYDFDRLKGKKAAVSILKFKDETSTTLLHFKLSILGASKRQITSDVTINSNAVQGTKKVSAIIDFLNFFKHPQSGKLCFSADFYSGFAKCPNKDITYPSVDYKFFWGDSCHSKDHLFIKSTYSPGRESQSLWQEYQRKCSDGIYTKYRECTKAYDKASTLTYAKYDIQYSKPIPKILLTVNNLLDKYLQCHLSDHLVTEDVSNEDGKISAELSYNLNNSLVYITINKPTERIDLYDVPYNDYVPLLLPRTLATSYIKKIANALTNDKLTNKCLIHQNGNIKTFNDVFYNYTLGECPHVIAKDCSSSNIFTVTASGNLNKKVAVEIQGHVIESSMNQPTGKDVEFTVDGKPYVVQSGELAVIRSQKEEDRYLAQVSVSDTSIAITSPPLGLIVTFNSESVQVVVSQFWKGKVCGICGEVSEHQYMTFLGPDQCLYSDGAAFARSYRLAGPHCGIRLPILGKVQCLPTASRTTQRRSSSTSETPGGIYRGPLDGTGYYTGGSGSRFESGTTHRSTYGGHHTGSGYESGSEGGFHYGESRPGRKPESGSSYGGYSGGESGSRFESGGSGGFPHRGSGSTPSSATTTTGSTYGGYQTGSGHESGSVGGFHYGQSHTDRRSESGSSHGGYSGGESGSTFDSGTPQGSYGEHRTGSFSESGSTGYHSGSWYSSRSSHSSGGSSYSGYESGQSFSSGGTLGTSGGFSAGSDSQISQSTDDVFPPEYPGQSHISQTSGTDEDEITAQVFTPLGSSSDLGGCYQERNLKTSRVVYTRGSQEDQTCFSTTPIRQCRSSCQAVDLIHKTVTFQCYFESSSVARDLSTSIEKAPLGKLPYSSISIEQDITIPEKCIPRQ